MITNNMTYAEATQAIDMMIYDCTSPDWDVNDPDNWQALASLLADLKTYITLEHVRDTV